MRTRLITLLIAIFSAVSCMYAQRKIEVYNNGEVVYRQYITKIDSIRFTDAEIQPEYNGHEYVDLGLSVKWATCNIGAATPEGNGYCFAWGETSPQATYTYNWSSYKWSNGNSTSITKYCVDSKYGAIDNKTALDIEDDAARANWGGSWRMPTKEELKELIINCHWFWTTENGEKGYKGTSVINGNSIFFPAAGYSTDGSRHFSNSYGCYWTTSLDKDDSRCAFVFQFEQYYSDGKLYSSIFEWCQRSREYGYAVRAVCD